MRTALLLNRKVRPKHATIWPITCSCQKHTWLCLPRNTKATKEAFWFNCPKCNSTKVVPRLQGVQYDN